MQGGYKAAALSGVKSATVAPPPANGSGATNGVKKANAKKKPATSDKGNGKPNGQDDSAAPAAPAAGRAPPPGFAKPGAATPNAWASPLPAVAAPAGFSDSQQRLLRHRALFVFRFLVGKAVEVTLVDASRYVGILDCVDPDDFSIVLKNTQRKGGDESPADGFDSGSTVIFKRRQLAHMAAEGVANYAEGTPALSRGPSGGAAPGFRTDTEISNRSHEHLYGRELESASSWLDPQLDTGDLEEPGRRKGAGWNQFEANEKLFGVVSTFDENLYTTKLDKSKFSNEKSREAERLAREIERETTGNFHLQEERGQAVHGGDDLDEEAKYSSVDRKHQSSPVARGPNAYVPPALRNASRPTSAGLSKQKPISPKTQTPPKAPPATVSAPVSTTPTPAPAAKVTSAPAPTPASAPAVPATPSATQAPQAAPVAEPTPTVSADASSQPRKPISFSEAVTGRPAARPSPTLAPGASPASAAPAPASTTTKAPAKQERKASASPKKQLSPKSEKPAKATSPPASKKEKEAKTPASKSQTDKKLAAIPSEKKPSDTKTAEEPKADKKAKAPKSEPSSKTTPASTPAQAASTTDAAAAAPAKKTTLNPKAKEFKLSASAASFTPKFATPPSVPVTSSPYRQPNAAPYGHMHPPPPHPAMGGMGYPPGPEEWMYDGMMLDDGEYAAAAAHAYMGYGMPMMPNPMMQQPMYAPMMPPQQNVRMGRGGGAGYGYNQPGMYNARGYYGQGAAPGAIPYHGAPGAVPGVPQPPLPPTPADASGPVDTPASPSLVSSSAPATAATAQRPPASSKNADAPSKK